MAEIKVALRTIDLRGAEQQEVRGRHVWKLQAMLNVWLRSGNSPVDENVPLLVTDGRGGRRTKDTLLLFQNRTELAPDAIAGPQTWFFLVELDGVIDGN